MYGPAVLSKFRRTDLEVTYANVCYWHIAKSMLTLRMSAFRGKADIPSSLANVR